MTVDVTLLWEKTPEIVSLNHRDANSSLRLIVVLDYRSRVTDMSVSL